MAKETIATPLVEFIGTGPYKLKERKPDQYVVLVRHDGYTARSETASGYAGRRGWEDGEDAVTLGADLGAALPLYCGSNDLAMGR